jgi:hypothetical protein
MAHVLTHRNVGTRASDDHEGHQEGNEETREHAVVDHDLQQRRYGGFHFGAAFYGWLVATGLSAILISLLGAGGAAVAVSNLDRVTNGTAATVGLVSGFLILVALAIAYYAGGYVAGRLTRFDGARQGFGAWLIGLIVTLVLGGIGAAAGAKYNVLQQMNLPHLPINQGSFTTGGLVVTLAALVITLLAAILGGKQGQAYHRHIDEGGEVGTVKA